MKCYVCGASGTESALFRFPKAEPYRTKWKNFAGIQEIGCAVICHRHFKEGEVYLRTNRRRLKRNVVPTISVLQNDNEYKTFYSNHLCLQCRTTDKRIHFKFPENHQRKVEWLKRCGYGADFFNGDRTWYLCSRHFPDGVISKKKSARGRIHLRLNALPTLFMTESNGESTRNATLSTPSTSSALCSITVKKEQLTSLSTNSEVMLDRSVKLCDASATGTVEQVACTSSTFHINSIDDYISPTTISKFLNLHSNRDCAECAAFKHHIRNSLDDVPCP